MRSVRRVPSSDLERPARPCCWCQRTTVRRRIMVGLAGRHDGTGRPIRVLHFLPWLAGGGVETALRELIRGLGSDAYVHHVACFEAQGPRRKDFEALNVPITVLGGKGSVRNVRAL